jgi:hypothetical protein
MLKLISRQIIHFQRCQKSSLPTKIKSLQSIIFKQNQAVEEPRQFERGKHFKILSWNINGRSERNLSARTENLVKTINE